ncbi:MAG: hypothetical protein OXE53_01290 [Deltaproteobacteria bacterium]|nr:hypothetical protein [Deltaproteobacteria bacterium]
MKPLREDSSNDTLTKSNGLGDLMAKCPPIKSERPMLRLLARGENEIAEGKRVDLETVLAEADALLAAEDS